MGLFTCKPVDAWNRDQPHRRVDRRKTPPRLRPTNRGQGFAKCLIFSGFIAALASSTLHAETLRIATYNVELSRKGPGLLLRDIIRGGDPQIDAIQSVLAQIQPDIVLLQGIDYDFELRTLTAFNSGLSKAGLDYTYTFAARPNTGQHTNLDMNLDGHTGGPKDAQSYGEFSGHKGMALLSRHPIQQDAIRDFSSLLWKDLPGAMLPEINGTPAMPPQVRDIQRLSYVGHWDVPIEIGKQTLNLLAFHASPPVFDGPEDRNGRRNHDELRFWNLYLDGTFGKAPDSNFIIIGDANNDPCDGEGHKDAILSLLHDPLLQDPAPKRSFPVVAQPGQHGNAMLDTVSWPDLDTMRVDYVLPSSNLRVIASGIYWPDESTPEGQAAATASRHRLVWVDIALD